MISSTCVDDTSIYIHCAVIDFTKLWELSTICALISSVCTEFLIIPHHKNKNATPYERADEPSDYSGN